ncbi:MAG TPA: hypothetical protein VIQ24_23150 [Pyrinomonadaceae bacterium]
MRFSVAAIRSWRSSGKDSNEVQAMGRKKVSEYKKPARKKASGNGQ